MSEIITIGLDTAKHVFQVHGVDEAGTEMIRRKAAAGRRFWSSSKDTSPV